MKNKEGKMKISDWLAVAAIIISLITIVFDIFSLAVFYNQNERIADLEQNQNERILNQGISEGISNQASQQLQEAEFILKEQIENCINDSNETHLLKNRLLFQNATDSFLKGNFNSTINFIKEIEFCIPCSECIQPMIVQEVHPLLLSSIFIFILLIIIIALVLYILLRMLIKKKHET